MYDYDNDTQIGLIIKSHPLPHFRERTEPIKYVIIHCSAYDTDKQYEILNELGLSAHYVVSSAGEVTEFVSPEKVAYHAGKSRWLGSSGESLNGCSIGIELESPDLGQSEDSYTYRQIETLLTLVKKLMIQYAIRPENILGHSDVSPDRKPDPGLYFPWKKLGLNGLGIQRTTGIFPKKEIVPFEERPLLEEIGYNTENLTAARYAFFKHFFPQQIPTPATDNQTLLDHPYPEDFTAPDWDNYISALRRLVLGYRYARAKQFWYEKKS
jgi:N-acetylmuramoyl-L-alanine amidase